VSLRFSFSLSLSLSPSLFSLTTHSENARRETRPRHLTDEVARATIFASAYRIRIVIEIGRMARLSCFRSPFSLSLSLSLSLSYAFSLLFIERRLARITLARSKTGKRNGRFIRRNSAAHAERTFLCDKTAVGLPPRPRPPLCRNSWSSRDLRSSRARTEIRVVQRKLAIAQCCHRRCR